MKALSLRQPWASLILCGHKSIETRTWRTHHRGPLLICAAAKIVRDPESGEELPRGVALCITDLVDCRPMIKSDEPAACCEIYPRAWAWVLDNVRAIVPFPLKGQLSLFDVPDALIHYPTDQNAEPRPAALPR